MRSLIAVVLSVSIWIYFSGATAFVVPRQSTTSSSSTSELLTGLAFPETQPSLTIESQESTISKGAAAVTLLGLGVACSIAAITRRSGALAKKFSSDSQRYPKVWAMNKFSPGYNPLPVYKPPLGGFEGLIGDQPPLGLWDPLGFTDDGDVAKFTKRRVVEIKHGRISMIATIGYIVPEYFKFPGELSPSEGIKFEDVPNGLGALSKVPVAGWAQIVAFCGLNELVLNKDFGEPGNYGKGFLGLGSVGISASIQNADVREKKLKAELANGRLAMAAIIGMFFQDGLTGEAWGDWALYTDSPLRAQPDFSGELGVQLPLGYWDPLGLAIKEDPEIAVLTFRRRRAVEIQHGRVCMLACIGYIVPEYFRWPGYASPSQEVAFADIPNGLAALTKLPFEGWTQIVGFCLCLEASNLQSPAGEYIGDYPGYGQLGIPFAPGIADKETKEKKLNAELANGRLAMVAIIGMFFQDGLTGSAWGDWANYTDSPLRAQPDFSGELGVQLPLGYWDPLGLAIKEDPEIAVLTFRRRRAVEIQHGRVCMIACIGYIVPEYFRWPGYASPSQEVAFADIPNGLAALTKLPFEGWTQIVGFCLCLEASNLQSPAGEYIGDYPGYGQLGIPFAPSIADKETKERKLNAEIANGRLAMVAIIGMFFQDGLTGSAWGDWANYTDSPLRAHHH